jgi:sugar lactone lactonase YvrE
MKAGVGPASAGKAIRDRRSRAEEVSMRRWALLAAAAAVTATALAAPLSAGPSFPDRIALPDGFRPEGIAIDDHTFYVGSIPTGAVYRGDLRTGQGAVFVEGTTDDTRAAIGMKVDRRDRLFVAGGPTGKAFVYDADNGDEIKTYQLTTSTTFVNDVIVTRSGAFFTDSVNKVIYRIPIARNGALGAAAETIPLTGDIVYDPAAFNANGIEATPDGEKLIIVQSGAGKLFSVDPESGVTDEIALSEPVTQGDGLLLDGKTLYVVRNIQERIAVVRLDRGLTSGTVVTHIEDPANLDVPTTIAEFGSKLYAVNARFTTTPTPTTPYWVTKLDKAPNGSGEGDEDEDEDEEGSDD